MSILSKHPDGMGYYYGFNKPDMRQINVRDEANMRPGTSDSDINVLRQCDWASYVAGKLIGHFLDKHTAELAALNWLAEHPNPHVED